MSEIFIEQDWFYIVANRDGVSLRQLPHADPTHGQFRVELRRRCGTPRDILIPGASGTSASDAVAQRLCGLHLGCGIESVPDRFLHVGCASQLGVNALHARR